MPLSDDSLGDGNNSSKLSGPLAVFIIYSKGGDLYRKHQSNGLLRERHQLHQNLLLTEV
jgi:hypothetical protein